MEVAATPAQINNRVADQLARAVISDVAAPIYAHGFDVMVKDVLLAAAVAHGVHRQMLEQQNRFRCGTIKNICNQLFLDGQSLRKSNQTKIIEFHG